MINKNRNKAKKIPQFKKEIIKSLQPTKNIMQDIFKWLELKKEKFSTFESATEQEIKYLWKSILEVNNSLVSEDTSKKQIKNKISFN